MMPPAKLVTAVFPSQAPHLGSIATEIEEAIGREFDKTLSNPATATRFAAFVAAEARAHEAFTRFRAALRGLIGC